MQEFKNVRQIPGEKKRRWFTSDDFDLIVWLTDDQHIDGFELCYDKRRQEHAIVWTRKAGYRHMCVDDGEARSGTHKGTPILGLNGHFDAARVHAAFAASSQTIPVEVAGFVLRTLERHPEFAGRPDSGATSP